MSEMNKELQGRLITYLEALEGAVSGTSDFVIEQMPMCVQEIIRWQIVEGIIWCIFFLAISLGLLVFNFTKLRSMRLDPHDGDGWALGTIVIIFSVFAIAVASAYGCQSLKAYLAPRVVIVEQLAGTIPIPLVRKK